MENTAPVGIDEKQNGTVPVAGVLLGRGGRFVTVAVGTTLALGAGVRGVVAMGSATPFPNPATGRVLLDAGVALVAAAAAWSVIATNPRAAAGVVLLLAGWLLPTWGGWSVWPRQVALVAAAPLTAAGAATVLLSWSSMSERRTHRLLELVLGAAGIAVAIGALGYDPFADPACAFRCGHVRPTLAGIVSTRGAVETAAVITLGLVAVAAVQLPRSRASRPVAVAVAAGLVLLAVGASAPLLELSLIHI